MSVAPGSILGFMAIRDVLKSRNALTGSFLDSGCGEGWAAIQLLELGFTEGTAVEPSKAAFDRAKARMDQLSEDRITLLNCRIDQLKIGGGQGTTSAAPLQSSSILKTMFNMFVS